jgi:hypothetical protein
VSITTWKDGNLIDSGSFDFPGMMIAIFKTQNYKDQNQPEDTVSLILSEFKDETDFSG